MIHDGEPKLVAPCANCSVVHNIKRPGSVDRGVEIPGIGLAGPVWSGGVSCRESAGLPSELQLAADGRARTARMPMLGDALSYTVTGRPAVKRPLSDGIARDLNIGALLLFHYPTTWNHFLADHAISFRVFPLTPTRTALTTKWLVHRDAVDGVDYDLEELTHVWVATNEQDRRIVHESQIGMNCPAYEPGPLSPLAEKGVGQFIDWYCSRLEQRLAPDGARKIS